MRSLIFFLCVILWIISCEVEAKNSVTENYKFYLLSPESKGEILKELNITSPIIEDGEIYHGYAYSTINWNFNWRYNKNSCWITSANTELNTTYTLPKLETKSNDVTQVWNKWYPKLVLHEKGHHKLAVNIAVRIENAISEMPKERTCQELEKKANEIGHALISELEHLNISYDKRTNHGETQGAFLSQYL